MHCKKDTCAKLPLLIFVSDKNSLTPCGILSCCSEAGLALYVSFFKDKPMKYNLKKRNLIH